METKYFTANWQLIDEDIKNGKESDIKEVLRNLYNEVSHRWNLNMENERKKRLKALPSGTTVYFTRLNDKRTPFRTEFKKIADRRTNMEVDRNGVQWLYPYTVLNVD